MKKQFLTQTGFKLNITAGKKYRWKIESSGKEQKMVEIAIAKKPLAQALIEEQLSSKGFNEGVFLR